jgi:hypothetical protein
MKFKRIFILTFVFLGIQQISNAQFVESDSSMGQYVKKIPLNPNISLHQSNRVRHSKHGTYLFEPYYNKRLYKLSESDGKILKTFDVSNYSIPYDTIIKIIYGTEINDSREIYYSLTIPDVINAYKEENFVAHDFNTYNNKVYISGRHAGPYLLDEKNVMLLNYNVILELDSNLKLLDYYVCKSLEYKKKYPMSDHLFNFNPDEFALQSILDQDAILIEMDDYRFKLAKPHEIELTEIHNYPLPFDFKCEQHSNYMGYYCNFGDIEIPVFLLKHKALIYLYNKNQMIDLKTGRQFSADTSFDCKSFFCTLWDVKRINNKVLFCFVSNVKVYKTEFDLEMKRVTNTSIVGDFNNFTSYSISDEGKIVMSPLTESTVTQYITIK